MSAKALSQRLKWRGLQKLKFYCQLCEKQMRDDNGFKCHMMSEAHQRNLLIAAESPEKYVSEYSQLFHRDYMALLQRRFGTQRVHCNVVYCEYVAHKTHYHMNATQWTTLTQYVQWLGDNGHCKIDYQDEAGSGSNKGGWYVQFIDKDPEVERRKKEIERLARKQQDMDERHNMKIAEMVARDEEKRAELEMIDDMKPQARQVADIDKRDKLEIAMPGSRKLADKYQEKAIAKGQEGFKAMVAQMAYREKNDTASEAGSAWSKSSTATKKPKMSSLQEIMLENERQKKVAADLKLEKEQQEEEALKEQEENMRKDRELMKKDYKEDEWYAARNRAKEKYQTLKGSIDQKRFYIPGERTREERLKSLQEEEQNEFNLRSSQHLSRGYTSKVGSSLSTVKGDGLEVKKKNLIDRVYNYNPALGIQNEQLNSDKHKQMLEDLKSMEKAHLKKNRTGKEISEEKEARREKRLSGNKRVREKTPEPKPKPEPVPLNEEDQDEELDDEESWLIENIAVKVTCKDLGPDIYKKKGKIVSLVDKYQAIVQMFKTNVKIKIDQTYLETIIPAVGREVLLLVGRYRGRTGKLKSIQSETGSVSIDLDETTYHKAKFLANVKYEEVSKLV